jgi:hypothetical protein
MSRSGESEKFGLSIPKPSGEDGTYWEWKVLARAFFGIKKLWRFVLASPISPGDPDREAKMEMRE